MDEKTLTQLADDALSSSMLVGALCEKYDMDIEELEEALLNMNIERCDDCDWWFESCLLHECKDGRWICPQCLKDAIVFGEEDEQQ